MEKKEIKKMEFEQKLLTKIDKVQLSIASPDEIRSWSSGEVIKPETINYKSYKPEKGGLFCEIIFGPVKDFRCPHCGKKHKRVDEGKKCFNCNEGTILSSLVRRRRMGHIELATPISHIWYTKVDYSMMRLLLDLKQATLEGVIYFKSHMVITPGKLKTIKAKDVIDIRNGPKIYRKILREMKSLVENPEDKKLIQEKIKDLEDFAMSDIGQDYGIDFYDYNDFIKKYSEAIIKTGSEAIKDLLANADLKLEKRKIIKLIMEKKDKNRLFRRLKVIEAFIESKQRPEHMILEVIPIIPPDLRPLIQLDGGRHSTADVNELLRRIIIRNTRLKQWIEIDAPELIIQNEKRMLQESVDALLDNERRKKPVMSKDGRPLKSLSENLKGKQGRFRQNLLGKRVDYSGRSVIVVGPELKLNQAGIPREMIAKLFEPLIVNKLVRDGIAQNIKRAKKMIENKDEKIWGYIENIIKDHPILLNRAPTLHRLSIQAFQPVITNGKAIRLHPLVTTPFNADFDGDQMAVYVPLSEEAKREANELMSPNKNILGPKDGKLIISPSQDMCLGLYYLTKFKTNKASKHVRIFNDLNEINLAYLNKRIDLHSPIVLKISAIKEKVSKATVEKYSYILTTPGRAIFNSKFPSSIPYLNDVSDESFNKTNNKYFVEKGKNLLNEIIQMEELLPFKKRDISKIIEKSYEILVDDVHLVLDAIKDLGFEYSTKSGISIGIGDIIEIATKDKIISESEELTKKLKSYCESGFTTDDERYLQTIDVWTEAREKIKNDLTSTLKKEKDNSLFMMMDSGARGNISNFVQLTGMRGLMSKAIHVYAALRRQNILVRQIEEIPIKSSFKGGLSTFEFYLSTHGARKGLSDTATKTAESGYLTRRLVDSVQDTLIKEEDCQTEEGFIVEAIKDTKTASIIESLEDRIQGRYSNENIKFENKIIVKKDELITKELASYIEKVGIKKINIRSVFTCKTKRGICKKCYGLDLTSGKEVNVGEAIGIISAQSIGEPGTQLTMRTFHTGGVAGVSDITQGFTRLLELVDANRNPKSPAKIFQIGGTVIEINKTLDNSKNQVVEIVVQNENETKSHIIPITAQCRVKKGQIVVPGQKITEGSIRLYELLEYAGVTVLQNYLIKEIQRLYRIQGIDIADKYMEVIIRQMLSKVIIINEGSTKFHAGEIVSIDTFKEENFKAMKSGKALAFAKSVIIGVKPLPLYSESFLAAASYQRTAEALVNAAINKKVDNLSGVKENLIVGKKIKVGTGQAKLHDGKYDILQDIIHKKNTYSNDDYSEDENDFELELNMSSFESNVLE